MQLLKALNRKPNVLDRERSPGPLISISAVAPEMDLVDVNIFWPHKCLELSCGPSIPHPLAWPHLEVNDYRKLGRAILGNKEAMLRMKHRVPVSGLRVTDVHSNRSILRLGL